MIQENLQINIGANTQDLQTGLNQATAAVNNFSNTLNNSKKPTADATNSLSNLSRIAQDAPYGFIGIANNLNPMLESFQRLQKEAGGTGAALKAMVSGLSGPAGIGVALAVASSAAVFFKKEIDELFIKLNSGSTYSVQYADVVKGIGGEFTGAVEKVNKVKLAFEQYHAGLLTGEQATKVYNDTLGKNLGFKNGINEAEDNFTKKSAAYIDASFKRAAADMAGKKAAEELLKYRVLQETGGEKTGETYKLLGQQLFNTLSVIPVFTKSASDKLFNIYDEDKANRQITKAKSLYDTFLSIQAKFQNEAQDIINKNPGINFDPDKATKTGKKSAIANANDELSQYYKDLQAYIREYESIKSPSENRAMNRKATIQEFELDKGDKTTKKLDKDLPLFAKDYVGEMNRFDKATKQAYDDAVKFADVLSINVTDGLMSVWDAMQKGENPLQALSNFLGQIIQKLIEAVAQAAIFQGIMMLLNPAAAGDFGTGFIGKLGKILGFAEGGIVSQPTIAMVGEGGQSEAIMPLNKLGNMMNSTFNAGAMSGTGGGGGNGQFVLKGNDLVLALQRSNYSLNLRRGA